MFACRGKADVVPNRPSGPLFAESVKDLSANCSRANAVSDTSNCLVYLTTHADNRSLLVILSDSGTDRRQDRNFWSGLC